MIPLEIITLAVSTFGSFLMKQKAQAEADKAKLLELSIKRDESTTTSANEAAKRGAPWVRKAVAIIIITVAFGGLLLAPILDFPIALIQEVPQKSILFGLIKWGQGVEVISVDGFMLPPYVRHAVMAIVGFFFGPAFCKVGR